MITFITGLPGNGKTLYALQYTKQWAEREGRDVWYCGIRDLKLDWKPIPTKVEQIDGKAIHVPQWWLCPAGSIVVIDEVQERGFAKRARGNVPEWAQKLEVHRHLGIDLVMITQAPMNVDSHDRSLCELHFHVVRSFGLQRAVVHEFRPLRESVLKNRKGSIEHQWSYPREAYEWYTSAEAHTHKARIPMKVWVLLALPIVLGALVWVLWGRLGANRANLHKPADGAGGPQALSQRPVQGSGSPKLSKAAYVEQFAPRVQGLDYTAPAYDDVTKPTQAPYPAACVSMGDKCRCYSQQGTYLQVGRDLCLNIVSGGFFVAWNQSAPGQVAAPPAARVPARDDVVVPSQAIAIGPRDAGDAPAREVASVLDAGQVQRTVPPKGR